MRRSVISLLILFSSVPVLAQTDPEYKMEIGAGVGMMGYLGDFNSSLFKDLQPMGDCTCTIQSQSLYGV